MTRRATADPDLGAPGDTGRSEVAEPDEDSRQQPEPSRDRVFSLTFSGPGLVVGALFLALSLQPSLLPRPALFQGVVSGITLLVGYGLGVLGQWIWTYLGLPTPHPDGVAHKVLATGIVGIVGFILALSIWRQVGWQNDVRVLFGMDGVSPSTWVPTIPVMLVVAALILIVSRSLRKLYRFIDGWFASWMPRRVARLIGVVVFAVLLVNLVNGVLIKGAFSMANQAFSTSDSATADGVEQPQGPERSGSADSSASWESLGRQGRSFVGTGPTVEELNEFSGGEAKLPIRTYAGLKSADTLQARADLVLEDLINAGAFDRKILVVATTTGTGYLVAEGMDTVEYLYNGDTAIVGVQYSYLPSWISLLADQQVTKDTSRAVFSTIHDYWSELPESSRPEIYLFGLSLGSFGAESILGSVELINEPIDGAVLVGPPFVNPIWTRLTAERDAGSPAWRPAYGEGRTVRFTSTEDVLDQPDGPWGDTRIAYLQHASDPVSFFSPDLALASPDWLEPDERGPDVSPEMGWFPLVTMWQVALDLPAAGSVPAGHGHLYTSNEYLSVWLGVASPSGWSGQDTERLRSLLAANDEAAD